MYPSSLISGSSSATSASARTPSSMIVGPPVYEAREFSMTPTHLPGTMATQYKFRKLQPLVDIEAFYADSENKEYLLTNTLLESDNQGRMIPLGIHSTIQQPHTQERANAFKEISRMALTDWVTKACKDNAAIVRKQLNIYAPFGLFFEFLPIDGFYWARISALAFIKPGCASDLGVMFLNEEKQELNFLLVKRKFEPLGNALPGGFDECKLVNGVFERDSAIYTALKESTEEAGARPVGVDQGSLRYDYDFKSGTMDIILRGEKVAATLDNLGIVKTGAIEIDSVTGKRRVFTTTLFGCVVRTKLSRADIIKSFKAGSDAVGVILVDMSEFLILDDDQFNKRFGAALNKMNLAFDHHKELFQRCMKHVRKISYREWL